MKKIQIMKEELKDLAYKIKNIKFMRKPKNFDSKLHTKLMKGYYNLEQMRWEFRHKHIAYCLLRGTVYDKIEQPNEGNEPDFPYIEEFKKKYYEEIKNEKDVCLDS